MTGVNWERIVRRPVAGRPPTGTHVVDVQPATNQPRADGVQYRHSRIAITPMSWPPTFLVHASASFSRCPMNRAWAPSSPGSEELSRPHIGPAARLDSSTTVHGWELALALYLFEPVCGLLAGIGVSDMCACFLFLSHFVACEARGPRSEARDRPCCDAAACRAAGSSEQGQSLIT